MSYQQEERFLTEKRKRFDDIQELPENRPALLLAAIYSGDEQKIYLKFYDMKDNTIYFWRDRTNHKPYCYTKMQHSDAIKKIAEKEKKYTLEQTHKRDPISDKEINLLKIIAPDPLSIGGTENSIREKVTSWEADIKYHENYLYDTGLIPGTYYIRTGDEIRQFQYQISDEVQQALKNLLWNRIEEEI
jgi:DNA polymerase I